MANKINIFQIQQACENTLMSHLGIEFTEVGADYLKAKMPVDKRTYNPMKILHGGATLALIETLGSGLSFTFTDVEKFNVFAIEVNANHIKTVTKGAVWGVAKYIHKGNHTQVVEVKIYDDSNELVSAGKVTNIVLEKNG